MQTPMLALIAVFAVATNYIHDVAGIIISAYCCCFFVNTPAVAAVAVVVVVFA